MSSPITYWNRQKNREEIETIYGDKFVRWLYETGSGQKAAHILTLPILSKLYGYYQSSSLSRSAAPRFIEQFKVLMDDYEEGPFKSFNDFFIRRFKPRKRIFASAPKSMPAFAEGRYFAFEKVKPENKFPVKGNFLSAEALLGKKDLAKSFTGGPLLIARLCPVDYHRYHYPDDGVTTDHYRVPGKLHSVNPLALKFKEDIFATNERYVSLLETKNFGKIAYIEVGAICVGKIVQTHPQDKPFKRGDEKGYFLFGASTVVIIGEPGAWTPDSDLVEKTQEGIETYIQLGDKISSAI